MQHSRGAAALGERWRCESINVIAGAQQHARDYYRVLLRLSYLAPDITQAILDGRQPISLTRQKLAPISLPLEWERQREVLGFAPG